MFIASFDDVLVNWKQKNRLCRQVNIDQLQGGKKIQ